MTTIFPSFSEEKLLEQILHHQIISIIGLGKNVGKTTTLNYLINLLSPNQKIAVTSIGRDGEKYDEVFGTPKPRIYINEGTILALARNSLENSDISIEILESTMINTPLGNIIIVRALSAGYVELTGPSTSHELKKVFNIFQQFGSEIILVDGAVNRRSFASPIITNATILATGASISPNFDEIILETEFFAKILTIPALEKTRIKKLVDQIPKIGIINEDNNVISFSVQSSLDLPDSMLELIDEKTRYFIVKGVFSNSLLDKLFSTISPHQPLTIVIPDSTKIFLDRNRFNLLQKTKWELKVLKAIRLLCITVNPTSPLGYEFNRTLLLQELRRRISVPIFDVYQGFENEK
ncbi:MAG: hypothetical protein DRO88_00240 [Promethearchaeia archaeon]|nr:MAG: hypothetical protein DRO88_00240 [Candidatus Lokiarchaeia archaeon]